MKQNHRLWSALALYMMMAAALLMVALLGARLYRSVTDAQQENDRMRATLAYVQSRVAAADAADGVVLADGPEGKALQLATTDSQYVVRIYLYQGNLVEETALVGSSFAPSSAQTIAACTNFDVTFAQGGVLAVTADGRTAYAAVRSKEASAA
ncbi:MAG: DUF4860 domain-containing protein [Faecalibacterium sp.]|jgi:hypothetical protein|nr:DUF4860 domain-containing protein [Faecalibacterium sp.]